MSLMVKEELNVIKSAVVRSAQEQMGVGAKLNLKYKR
jgi:hypothetical protein